MRRGRSAPCGPTNTVMATATVSKGMRQVGGLRITHAEIAQHPDTTCHHAREQERGDATEDRVRYRQKHTGELAEDAEDDEETRARIAGPPVRTLGQGDDPVVLGKDAHRCDRPECRTAEVNIVEADWTHPHRVTKSQHSQEPSKTVCQYTALNTAVEFRAVDLDS
jgi:hypothetical protein